MDEEITAIERNNIWELTELPRPQTSINVKQCTREIEGEKSTKCSQ